MKKLVIVLPCYNEEEVLEISIGRLIPLLNTLKKKNKITEDSFLLFVNDGSRDKTWEIIEKNYELCQEVNGIKLAKNVGHQNALWAGMMTAKEYADVVITIDADLQDDITVIEEMIDKYLNGKQIVYGVKQKRKVDSFAKRITAEGYYKLMEALGVKTVYNHADFRLLSKEALEALAEYKESNLYIRGIIPLLGFETDCVYEEIKEREAGKSKYSLKKMVNLAVNGITSFSIKPLSAITYLGAIAIFVSMIFLIVFLVQGFSGKTISEWNLLSASIWFVGGVQLLSLGIVGQYIGKIYTEVKGRPRYYKEKELLHK